MTVISQSEPFRIFVGWDSKEPEAYDVVAHSLCKHASIPLDIRPIKQTTLRDHGLYWRSPDPLASTEFTYTRFFTPFLAGYEGWAMFCDCDFLFLHDIAKLLQHVKDERKAVYVVQHPDYTPHDRVKMDGAIQTSYPRKNWSSLMIFNCAHVACRLLTPATINRESGAFLHRLNWAKDDQIGSLPMTWNWLEGEYKINAVHFTRGGPWLKDYEDVEFAELWRLEKKDAGL